MFGRDERRSKNWRWQRRPVRIKEQSVDVDRETSSLVNVDQEKSSLVDINQWKSAVWSTSTEKRAVWLRVDGWPDCPFLSRLQPALFITPPCLTLNLIFDVALVVPAPVVGKHWFRQWKCLIMPKQKISQLFIACLVSKFTSVKSLNRQDNP